jgi:hypothetical protein
MRRADREAEAAQAVEEAAAGTPGDRPDARQGQGQIGRVQLNPGKLSPRRQKSCCSCRKA